MSISRPYVAVPWTDHVNANPLLDLQACAAGLVNPVAVMSSETANHLLRNAMWRSFFDAHPDHPFVPRLDDVVAAIGVAIEIADALPLGRVIIGRDITILEACA